MDEIKRSLLHSITGPAWKKIGVHPHHGINLPLSSLHSKNSCGIGEFFDLLPIIDWCQRLKLDFIQLLPLNDSETDPSPYNAISSCSLNIFNLSLHALPHLEKQPQLKEKLNEFSKLNATQKISYPEVFAYKINWLHTYFDAVGDTFVQSKELKRFIEENSWVEPYALFKTLTESLGGVPLSKWPPEMRFPSPKEFKDLLKRHHPAVSFYITLQYLCYTQLKEVKEYANRKGVFLMGDLPILVSAQSADVWQFPDFFDLTLQAGAPPDFYNKEGQNWGFPIYQWGALRKNGFQWWTQRLEYAENFFNLFRLDHVLGFFRIWGIPPGQPAKDGHFVPLDEEEWGPQGKELLSMIAQTTSMLPIAEDLGVVHDVVPPTLKELGICGTKVMRWERKWKEDKRFIPFQDYPQVSITCLSTHDSETTTLWWKYDIEETKAYAEFKHWTYAPTLTKSQLFEILWDCHHTPSLFHVNLLQEYLALFPELVWPNPEEERINIPGKVLPANWAYRYRPSVEEITSHRELFSAMEKILYSPTPTL